MNLIEAMKRSKETGERFRRHDVSRSWPNSERGITFYGDGDEFFYLTSACLIAEDWQPIAGTGDAEKVKAWERQKTCFVYLPGDIDSLPVSREDAEKIVNAPDGKMVALENLGFKELKMETCSGQLHFQKEGSEHCECGQMSLIGPLEADEAIVVDSRSVAG